MTTGKTIPKRQSRNPEGRPKCAEKRVAIMDAAELHFLEQGYAGTSMDQVAKTALVSKLTIYSHFADKDALFQAVMERKCEQHSMSHGYLHLADLPLNAALEEIGNNFVGLILSDESIKLYRTIIAESSRDSKSARLFYEVGPARVRRAFIELLKLWVKQKRLKVKDYDMAYDHFFSVMKGETDMQVSLNIMPRPAPATLKKLVRAGVTLFLNTYALSLPSQS